jgi:hypothetical protein
MAVTIALSEPPQIEKSALASSGHRKRTSSPGEEALLMTSKKCEVTEIHKPALPLLDGNVTLLLASWWLLAWLIQPGASVFLQNVGQCLLLDYTASHSRR